MPYIDQASREQLDEWLEPLIRRMVSVSVASKEMATDRGMIRDRLKGIHNYVMFTIAVELARRLGIRYHVLQDIVGTFECCKQEFIRRVVSPYEDGAIKRNGDVDGIPNGG